MVNVPDIPPVSARSPLTALTWWWRLADSRGQVITVGPDYDAMRFPNQADAESWVGEFWADVAALGVDSVTLMEGDREVYGPMSLQA
jgi:hypothetical protein